VVHLKKHNFDTFLHLGQPNVYIHPRIKTL